MRPWSKNVPYLWKIARHDAQLLGFRLPQVIPTTTPTLTTTTTTTGITTAMSTAAAEKENTKKQKTMMPVMELVENVLFLSATTEEMIAHEEAFLEALQSKKRIKQEEIEKEKRTEEEMEKEKRTEESLNSYERAAALQAIAILLQRRKLRQNAGRSSRNRDRDSDRTTTSPTAADLTATTTTTATAAESIAAVLTAAVEAQLLHPTADEAALTMQPRDRLEAAAPFCAAVLNTIIAPTITTTTTILPTPSSASVIQVAASTLSSSSSATAVASRVQGEKESAGQAITITTAGINTINPITTTTTTVASTITTATTVTSSHSASDEVGVIGEHIDLAAEGKDLNQHFFDLLHQGKWQAARELWRRGKGLSNSSTLFQHQSTKNLSSSNYHHLSSTAATFNRRILSIPSNVAAAALMACVIGTGGSVAKLKEPTTNTGSSTSTSQSPSNTTRNHNSSTSTSSHSSTCTIAASPPSPSPPPTPLVPLEDLLSTSVQVLREGVVLPSLPQEVVASVAQLMTFSHSALLQLGLRKELVAKFRDGLAPPAAVSVSEAWWIGERFGLHILSALYNVFVSASSSSSAGSTSASSTYADKTSTMTATATVPTMKPNERSSDSDVNQPDDKDEILLLRKGAEATAALCLSVALWAANQLQMHCEKVMLGHQHQLGGILNATATPRTTPMKLLHHHLNPVHTCSSSGGGGWMKDSTTMAEVVSLLLNPVAGILEWCHGAGRHNTTNINHPATARSDPLNSKEQREQKQNINQYLPEQSQHHLFSSIHVQQQLVANCHRIAVAVLECVPREAGAMVGSHMNAPLAQLVFAAGRTFTTVYGLPPAWVWPVFRGFASSANFQHQQPQNIKSGGVVGVGGVRKEGNEHFSLSSLTSSTSANTFSSSRILLQDQLQWFVWKAPAQQWLGALATVSHRLLWNEVGRNISLPGHLLSPLIASVFSDSEQNCSLNSSSTSSSSSSIHHHGSNGSWEAPIQYLQLLRNRYSSSLDNEKLGGGEERRTGTSYSSSTFSSASAVPWLVALCCLRQPPNAELPRLFSAAANHPGHQGVGLLLSPIQAVAEASKGSWETAVAMTAKLVSTAAAAAQNLKALDQCPLPLRRMVLIHASRQLASISLAKAAAAGVFPAASVLLVSTAKRRLEGPTAAAGILKASLRAGQWIVGLRTFHAMRLASPTAAAHSTVLQVASELLGKGQSLAHQTELVSRVASAIAQNNWAGALNALKSVVERFQPAETVQNKQGVVLQTGVREDPASIAFFFPPRLQFLQRALAYSSFCVGEWWTALGLLRVTPEGSTGTTTAGAAEESFHSSSSILQDYQLSRRAKDVAAWQLSHLEMPDNAIPLVLGSSSSSTDHDHHNHNSTATTSSSSPAAVTVLVPLSHLSAFYEYSKTKGMPATTPQPLEAAILENIVEPEQRQFQFRSAAGGAMSHLVLRQQQGVRVVTLAEAMETKRQFIYNPAEVSFGRSMLKLTIQSQQDHRKKLPGTAWIQALNLVVDAHTTTGNRQLVRAKPYLPAFAALDVVEQCLYAGHWGAAISTYAAVSRLSRPNRTACLAALKACGIGGQWEVGVKLFCDVCVSHPRLHPDVYAAAIDMLLQAKETARAVIVADMASRQFHPRTASSALMVFTMQAYVESGLSHKATEYFYHLVACGILPSASAMLLALKACRNLRGEIKLLGVTVMHWTTTMEDIFVAAGAAVVEHLGRIRDSLASERPRLRWNISRK